MYLVLQAPIYVINLNSSYSLRKLLLTKTVTVSLRQSSLVTISLWCRWSQLVTVSLLESLLVTVIYSLWESRLVPVSLRQSSLSVSSSLLSLASQPLLGLARETTVSSGHCQSLAVTVHVIVHWSPSVSGGIHWSLSVFGSPCSLY